MMVRRNRIELKGQTRFERNGTKELLHQMAMTIERGTVTMSVEGMAEDDEDAEKPKPVVSTHPAVEQHYREVDAALVKSAYMNRPIHSIFKPVKPVRRRRKG